MMWNILQSLYNVPLFCSVLHLFPLFSTALRWTWFAQFSIVLYCICLHCFAAFCTEPRLHNVAQAWPNCKRVGAAIMSQIHLSSWNQKSIVFLLSTTQLPDALIVCYLLRRCSIISRMPSALVSTTASNPTMKKCPRNCQNFAGKVFWFPGKFSSTSITSIQAVSHLQHKFQLHNPSCRSTPQVGLTKGFNASTLERSFCTCTQMSQCLRGEKHPIGEGARVYRVYQTLAWL